MRCETLRTYDVTLARGLLSGAVDRDLESLLRARQVVVVTTPTVASLFGESVVTAAEGSASSVELVVLPCTEQTKSLRSLELLFERAQDVRIERDALLVALGGGVCSDLVTFAAAVVRRGIDHVRIPTTLVGQVDAGVGIKGAVNHLGKKSFLGVFHPPCGVFVDVAALATLPARHISDGMAEIVKIALVRSSTLFELAEASAETLVATRFQCEGGEDAVAHSIRAIMAELEPNAYEDHTYERRVDLGHTFSPALEAAYGFRITHGMAVAIDLALSAAIGVEIGSLGPEELDRILELLGRSGLPMDAGRLTVSLCAAALVEAESHRGGSLNLVVPHGIGDVVFLQDSQSVATTVLPAALARLRAHAPRPRIAAVG